MRLFGKKQTRDDEEGELESGIKSKSSGKNPPSSKLRRIKKEPPKPWGRKERLLVLALILLTAGTSGFLSLSARAWKLPGLPRIKAPKVSVPFFGEETIILEG